MTTNFFSAHYDYNIFTQRLKDCRKRQFSHWKTGRQTDWNDLNNSDYKNWFKKLKDLDKEHEDLSTKQREAREELEKRVSLIEPLYENLPYI